MTKPHNKISWNVKTTLEKYATDNLSEAPYETLRTEGNLLVNTGINALFNLLAGAGGTAFNNANTYIGVGDSATAAAATQTDLQASTNKVRVIMDSSYPTSGTSQLITFRATYTSAVANWVWNEWGIFNASSAGTMLNRKVESLGTKSGGSWVLTVQVSLS